MKRHIAVVFKNGRTVVARVDGRSDIDPTTLTQKEAEEVLIVENLLEKLTGYRVHVNTVAGA